MLPPMPHDPARVRTLVARIFAMWNTGDTSAVPQLYCEDYVADYRPYSYSRGHDGIRTMVQGSRANWGDYHEELLDMVVEGDRVALRFLSSGTHIAPFGPIPPTGKRVEREEMVFLELRDGRVARQRGLVDNLSILRQLGAVPTPPGQPVTGDD